MYRRHRSKIRGYYFEPRTSQGKLREWRDSSVDSVEDTATQTGSSVPMADALSPQKLQRTGDEADETEETASEAPRITLLDLPAEIWFEVFEHVNLLDLLRLTRTCKLFRGCLMRPSVVNLWKRTCENDLQGLPECPPDLDLPAWASLAMDNYCHSCGRKAASRVMWTLRRRSCKSCFDDKETFMYVREIKDWDYPFSPLQALRSDNTLFLTGDVAEFQEAAKVFANDEEGFRVFVSERMAQLKVINEHADRCRYWKYYRTREITKQLKREREIRAKIRRDTIQRRLKDEGYLDYLKAFKSDFPGRFKGLACVIEGPDAVSDKDWERMKPALIKTLKEEETRRNQEKNDEAIAALATLPELQDKRISRSMFRAMKK